MAILPFEILSVVVRRWLVTHGFLVLAAFLYVLYERKEHAEVQHLGYTEFLPRQHCTHLVCRCKLGDVYEHGLLLYWLHLLGHGIPSLLPLLLTGLSRLPMLLNT